MVQQDRKTIEAFQNFDPDYDADEHTHIRLEVPQGHHEMMRLDKYITEFVQNATRSKVKDAIDLGYVLVNGQKRKASYSVQPHDVIDISLPTPPPPEAEPEDIPLDIVHEDDHIIVVNKPAGMVVHPAFGNRHGTLVNGLLHHVGKLANDEDVLRPGIVHRLDKDTSGLLVVAKTEIAHNILAKQFAERKVSRSYQAISWGVPEKESGTISAPLGRSKKDRKKMAVVPEGEGKHAVTHYRVLEYFDHLSHIEINLKTGRTHQIRVHFQHAGMPVFGDPTYGGDRVVYGPNTGSRKQMYKALFIRLSRQCLHAKTLGFVHPHTGEEVFFDSELPEDFSYALTKIKKLCTMT